MKAFLKVLLLLLIALLAIKFLPLTIGLGFAAGLVIVALVVAGVSLLAGLAVLVLALGAVLSPIWIPVLALVGFIALIRRCTRRSTPA